MNLYGFVFNSPVITVDLLGNKALEAWIAKKAVRMGAKALIKHLIQDGSRVDVIGYWYNLDQGKITWDFTEMRALTPEGEDFIRPFWPKDRCTPRLEGDIVRQWKWDKSLDHIVTYENYSRNWHDRVLVDRTRVWGRRTTIETRVEHSVDRVTALWWSFVSYKCTCSTEDGETQWFWEEYNRTAAIPIKVMWQPIRFKERMLWTYRSWDADELSLLNLVRDIIKEFD